MSNRFVADPYTLRNKGSEIIDKSQEFGENINKIYQTVNEMINSNYLDPAARAIAQEIETYRDDLDKMTKVCVCKAISKAKIKESIKLGADTLDIVELVMALEEEFDIEIPDSDAEKVVTVGDVVDYIKENVK